MHTVKVFRFPSKLQNKIAEFELLFFSFARRMSGVVGDMEHVKRMKEVKEDSEVVVKQKRGRRRTEEEVSVLVEEEEVEENTPMMVSNNPHLPTVVIKPRMAEVSSKFCLLLSAQEATFYEHLYRMVLFLLDHTKSVK